MGLLQKFLAIYDPMEHFEQLNRPPRAFRSTAKSKVKGFLAPKETAQHPMQI